MTRIDDIRRIRSGEQPQDPNQQVMDPQQMAMMQAGVDPMMMGGIGGYNPLAFGSSPDTRRIDRWLEYRKLKPEDEGKFWVSETDLAEELTKANLTREEAQWFNREYFEIETLAGGEGNEEWVKSRQRRFMVKLRITRSRSDNKEIGIRDATLLNTQNVNQVSQVKMPEAENTGGGGGWFGLGRRK